MAEFLPPNIAEIAAVSPGGAPKKSRRAGRIAGAVAAALLLLLLLVPLGTGLYFIFRGETLALAGYRFLMVPTEELQPTIQKNALILVEEIPAYDVTVGSYVSFRAGSGEAVQRVKEIIDDGKSLVFYLTLPSAGAPVIMVPGSEITGVVTMQYDNLGAAISFVTSPPGTAAVLGVPIALIVLFQVLSVGRRRRKRALPAPPPEAFRYDDEGDERAEFTPAFVEIEASVFTGSPRAEAATPEEPPETGDAHSAPGDIDAPPLKQPEAAPLSLPDPALAAPVFRREEHDFTVPGNSGGKARRDAFDDLLKDFDDI